MRKKEYKYLILIFIIIIIIIISFITYKYLKKETFEDTNNIQDALKLANYAGKRGIDISKTSLIKSNNNNYPPELLSIRCVDGKCPGLGQGFDLRKKDINDPLQFLAGHVLFKDTNIKTNDKCFLYFDYQNDKPSMTNTNSTKELMHSIATSNNVSASIPVEIATVSVTADVATKSKSSSSNHVKTSMLSLIDGVGSVTFNDGKECRFDNLDINFKNDIDSLANVAINNPSDRATWSNYFTFFEKWGTHVMTQIVFGSKLQYWESLISDTSSTDNILQIKACLKADMVGTDAGGSICSGFTDLEIKNAKRTDTVVNINILGGGEGIRKKLTAIYFDGKIATQADILEFLNSSNNSNQAIGYIFTPIWKVILSMLIGYCVDDTLNNNSGSQNCKIMQMANNLEAAFAYDTVKCEKLTTSYDNKVYQEFRQLDTGSKIKEYQCWAAKTGCTSASKDCHFNTGGTGCVAYGPSALNTGTEYELASGKFRTKIQGTQFSSDKYEGINDSCYHGKWGCDCDYNWAGGLPDRSLWKSGD